MIVKTDGQPPSWKAPSQPTTEVEFAEMVIDLERFVGALGLLMHQRPFHAAVWVGRSYGYLNFFPIPELDHYEPFSAGWLVAKTQQWFQERYGDRAMILPEVGDFVIDLNGAPWRVRVPFASGFVTVVNRNLKAIAPTPPVSSRPHLINILDLISDLTQSYANALSDQELAMIEDTFDLACDALFFLDAIELDQVLFRQARIDYLHSVEALLAVERGFGKARRDTATACEKVVKGVLVINGKKPPQHHGLVALGELLMEIAPNYKIDIARVGRLSTPADVSYDMPVSQQEALAAHYELLRFLQEIAPQYMNAQRGI